jgi:formylglycine-generating enzyme required for sulfatase activity
MKTRTVALGSAVLLIGWTAIDWFGNRQADSIESRRPSAASRPVSRLKLVERGGMIRIPGGTFLMGSPSANSADAWPQHRVALDPFWLDAAPVTNAQFEAFVAATDYETTAERRGHSLVLNSASRAWQTIEGADWRHPGGPNSSIAGRENWPVVQVSWHDAVRYARWAGKRLVTEAEYEFAARGGLADCDFPWGRYLLAADRHWANAWQGRFPDFDLGRDGYAGLAPTDAFPSNRYGLFDMAGNVYCWCDDWYSATYYGHSPMENPRGPEMGETKVQRGGSWLSAANHEPLAVWRRRAADPYASTNHVGFRCASDLPPASDTSSLLAELPGKTPQ